MIRYRDKNGNWVETEGDLYCCEDIHGERLFANDRIVGHVDTLLEDGVAVVGVLVYCQRDDCGVWLIEVEGSGVGIDMTNVTGLEKLESIPFPEKAPAAPEPDPERARDLQPPMNADARR